ncbi:CPBP family intramembrane glutamic endopeptidase [Lachnospiraceae bacterium 48-21]
MWNKRVIPKLRKLRFNCSYLFATALLEEMAWRGFLLNKLATAKGKEIALAYVGIIWVIWHIPMWAVRNSLGFSEILMYAIWTVLISLILGILFYRYKNILIVTLSHMIFNTCFITPMKYNVILLAFILILSFIIFNKKIDTV